MALSLIVISQREPPKIEKILIKYDYYRYSMYVY